LGLRHRPLRAAEPAAVVARSSASVAALKAAWAADVEIATSVSEAAGAWASADGPAAGRLKAAREGDATRGVGRALHWWSNIAAAPGRNCYWVIGVGIAGMLTTFAASTSAGIATARRTIRSASKSIAGDILAADRELADAGAVAARQSEGAVENLAVAGAGVGPSAGDDVADALQRRVIGGVYDPQLGIKLRSFGRISLSSFGLILLDQRKVFVST